MKKLNLDLKWTNLKLPNFKQAAGLKVRNIKINSWIDEHNRFLEAIEKFGRDWKKVQKFVGSRSSTQSRSHAQKFFKKLNLTNIDLGLSLTKHKSVDVRARVVNKLRIIEEEGGSDTDSEILIWIDFINTEHPKLRNPDFNITENKLKETGSEIKNWKDLKSDEDNDSFFKPNTKHKKKVKANSEKSIKQFKLLLSSTNASKAL